MIKPEAIWTPVEVECVEAVSVVIVDIESTDCNNTIK